MAFRPIARPTGLPPQVNRLLWKLERHYLGPAHSLLLLPISNYRIDGEFAFAIAHLLLAAIAGLSTTIYEQSGSNGGRFKDLLLGYYPFDTEPGSAPPPRDAAAALWSVFRNSLAHDLGFDVERKAKTPETKLLRVLTKTGSGVRGLTEPMIKKLEVPGAARPVKAATVMIRSDATVLSVDALYWGTRVTAERLFADSARVTKAEAFLASLKGTEA